MTDQAIELVELLNPRTQKEAPDIPINTENYACDVEDEVNNGEEIVENEDKPKSPWRQIIKPVKPCDDSQTYELFPLWRIPLYTGQATERVEVVNQPTQKEVPDVPYEAENIAGDCEDVVDNVKEIRRNQIKV